MEIENSAPERKFSLAKTLLLVGVVAIVPSGLTAWVVVKYLFPREFKPVELSVKEEQVLDAKLQRLQSPPSDAKADRTASTVSHGTNDKASGPLEPEPYSEDDARRQIHFSERELNALLARNTDLAHKLAIDLSDDLASAKLLLPLDPEFPFIGGKTLKVTAGLALGYTNGQPIVKLKGISLWGVPLPNAWLGGIKDIDLVERFGAEGGFWQAFAAGIEYIRVEEGRLGIKLKP